ncbi:hypothetical protein GCM10028803_00430 [Larkinella knui]
MKKSTSALKQGANQIREEFRSGLNTAERVGGWMVDLLESTVLEYDPASPYQAGRWVIYGGILYKAIAATQAAQTPLSHPQLWEGKLITNPDLIVEDGPDLPVAGPALFQYIRDRLANNGNGGSVPDADKTTKGIVRRADAEDFDYLQDQTIPEKDDINAYVGPALLLYMLDLLFGNGGLDATLKRGNDSDRDLIAGTISRKKFAEGTATHVPGLARTNGVWREILVPIDLLNGGSGGSQLPTPPTGGIPAQTFTVGTPFSYTLLPWSNVETYEVKDLPAGLTFNSATRTISGTGTLSGNYVVTVTGISPQGTRSSIAVNFTGQNAAISRYIDELSFQRNGSSLKWTLKGEGGPEGLRIKVGTNGSGFLNAAFADMVKVGNNTYEYTSIVSDGAYTVRVEQKVGTGNVQVGFELSSPSQAERIYPAQVNLLTGRGAWASSGAVGVLENVNDLNLENTFTTLEELQPIVGALGISQNGQTARWDRVLIYSNAPETLVGAYVFIGENIFQAPGSFQTNINRTKVTARPLVGTTSPFYLDVSGLRGDMIAIQRPDTGAISFNEILGFGDFPVINHPPVLATVGDIVITEGQSLSRDLKSYASDVDGDAITLSLSLEGGFALPSWMSLPNGVFNISPAPWEGGSVATSKEYPLVLTATDSNGASTTTSFKLRVQRLGTLESLLNAQIKYDYFSPYRVFTIGALVTDSGPMRVNLEGVGFTYGGQGFVTMVNGSIDNFSKPHNKLVNAFSGQGGFSNVQPGNYTLTFQEFENGPTRSFAVTIPSGNIDAQVLYEKSGGDTPTTGSITSITHALDPNGKPIITAVATAPVEIAITQIQGTGWSTTGYAAGGLVFGNSTYQRSYNTVAGEGSYRYDVRIIGTNIVQSGAFTIGATAADYFLQVDWREITIGVNEDVLGFFNLYVQASSAGGVEWKWIDSNDWREMSVSNGAGLSVISGATLYVELDYNRTPVSNTVRTLELRRVGTTNVLRVTVPVGYPPHDTGSGPFFPIWTAELLVSKGVYKYDPNNKAFSVYFEPKVSGKIMRFGWRLTMAPPRPVPVLVRRPARDPGQRIPGTIWFPMPT